MTRFGFVTGLRSESKLIETAAPRAPAIFCAGGDAGRAEAGAARLIAQGAQVIVSFGLCGGLNPEFQPGALILAEAVVQEDGRRFDTDPSLRSRLISRLQASGGVLFGSDRAIASADDKSYFHRTLGAGAVDMESHGAARAAAKAGVPFLVLRALADPAGRDLPLAAQVAMAPDGGIRHGAVLGALTRRPWEIPAMLRLAGNARAGLAALERAVRAVPVLLGGG